MPELIEELRQQPEALRGLLETYRHGGGAAIPPPPGCASLYASPSQNRFQPKQYH